MAELTKKTDKENQMTFIEGEDGLVPIEGAPVLTDYQKKAEQMYAPYKPAENELDVVEPQKSDYQRGQEWFNTYFPTISKDEEQRRETQVRNAARWQLFGNAAASIANAIGGWNGGTPVTVPEVKYPDLQTWKTQLNTERKARAVQEDADRKAYTTAYNTWMQGKLTNDKYNAKRLDEWQSQTAKYARALQEQDFKKAQQGDKEAAAKLLQAMKNDNAVRIARIRANSKSSGGNRSHSNKDRYDTMDKGSLTNEFESRKSNMPYADRKAKTPAAMAAALRRLDYQQGKTRTTSSSGGSRPSGSSSGSGSSKTPPSRRRK